MQDNKHDRRQECTAEPGFDAFRSMSAFEINLLVAKSLIKGYEQSENTLGERNMLAIDNQKINYRSWLQVYMKY